MDPKYLRSHDPLVGLAFAAAATSKLILGTAVCLVNQHDTIALAKQVSSLDVLSGGRLVLGVGAGWNEPEMRNHGIDPRTRHGSMLERVQAMKAIWTHDEAEFHGKHVDFDPIWQWPKPLQEPHTPVYLGGNGPLSRIASCATATAGSRARGRSTRCRPASPRCASARAGTSRSPTSAPHPRRSISWQPRVSTAR